MDHFYAFLIFALLLVLEQMAANAWLAVYYRYGIPVMWTRRRLAVEAVPPGRLDPETIDPRELAKALTGLFKARPDHPSIQFRALKTRSNSHVELAFHESLFEARAGFRYIPVTHALARLRLDQGDVTVTGYIDWYVLFVLVYLVLNSIRDQSFIFIAVIVVILFGVSYLFQRAVGRLVAERIETVMAQQN